MKKQYFQKLRILSLKSFTARFFWALFVCLLVTLPLLIVSLWYQDHKQQKVFEAELTKKQIQIIIDDNERSRINRDYGKLAKEIWRLSAFEKIVLFDKSSECKILAQMPLNGPSLSCLDKNRLDVDDQVSELGKISFLKKERSFLFYGPSAFTTLGILTLFILIFSTLLTYFLRTLLLNPFRKLQEDIRCLKNINSGIDEETAYPLELLQIKDTIVSTKKELFLAQKEIQEQSRKAVLGEIASQVSHDIRSPLAALDMAIKDIGELPEETRLIIRHSVSRIRDIANNLLSKNRNQNTTNNEAPPEQKIETVLLSSLIESLVSEKRMQFRSKLGIQINFDLNEESYGLFAKVEARELKRIISNLINNSVEAFEDDGEIKLTLKSLNDQIEIQVKDNGKGIPPEVLKKLGQKGESFGKKEGNGLGLYHARTTLESWGGGLKFESMVGAGTSITVTLSKTTAPIWFVEKLQLGIGSRVVVIDDDSSIHQIWDRRFGSAQLVHSKIEIIHLSNPTLAKEWFAENKDTRETQYLVDFEFLGSKTNGLELIKDLQIEKQAYLVTSRYEEEDILKKCLQEKINLIPKNLAGFITIATQEPLRQTSILLDDDELMRLCWKSSAKKKGILLETFTTAEELLTNIHLYHNESTFYIDAELGEGKKSGLEVAKELFEKGFSNIYIETGHEPERFKDAKWIKGVLGKSPVF